MEFVLGNRWNPEWLTPSSTSTSLWRRFSKNWWTATSFATKSSIRRSWNRHWEQSRNSFGIYFTGSRLPFATNRTPWTSQGSPSVSQRILDTIKWPDSSVKESATLPTCYSFSKVKGEYLIPSHSWWPARVQWRYMVLFSTSYREGPGPSIRYHWETSLKEMVTSAKVKQPKKLFYQRLTMAITELESKRQFKCTWVDARLKVIISSLMHFTPAFRSNWSLFCCCFFFFFLFRRRKS